MRSASGGGDSGQAAGLRDVDRRFAVAEAAVLENARPGTGVAERCGDALAGDGAGCLVAYHEHSASGAMPEWHGRLRETTAWIAENPGAHLTVKSIAERAGMAPKSLEAAFKAVLCTSDAGFVAAQRLAVARKKLETTDATISAIAQECGFCDHSHFTKAFRARWGLPPGAYRKSFRLTECRR
ncbi:MAG: helix-turn-helix transcriptional regulator [Kiritimatiellae bacterium]|nr:helix-turn-helix transcriptional regulator [Kiritimatiellia bacterium]